MKRLPRSEFSSDHYRLSSHQPVRPHIPLAEKQFRSDLYYRLNVFPIVIPPLRFRREDIPSLVTYFVNLYAQRMNKRIEKIPSEALEALSRYDWPGNIRELQNFVERSMILSTGSILNAPVSELLLRRSLGNPTTMEECEREHILKTVEETNWVIGGPHGEAARLGLPRSTLMYRMRKLAIVNGRSLPVSYNCRREQTSA